MIHVKKLILALSLTVFTVCMAQNKSTTDTKWVGQAVKKSGDQLLAASALYKDSGKIPRTFEHEKACLVTIKDWTCGFFPGSLWYLYELTGKPEFRTEAERFTGFLDKVQYRKDTHDLGFMIQCSYGNGYRLTKNEAYKKVMITGASSLQTRFHSQVGLIKSWDNRPNWQYPVIIDNMMNLEFLCEVAKMTKNNKLVEISKVHADNTLKNHFRSDNSCYHVVDYDSINGKVIGKETHQGYGHETSWARGQAWAIYGYSMMYRETKDKKYLDQAEKVARFILNNPTLPSDKIPYWDFNAPNIPNEPRDASAAAIIASALLEMSVVAKNNTYFKSAELMLKNLSSDRYFAKKGENGCFILMHSTGNWPKHSEIDTPLNYADYYYLEALLRYAKIMKIDLRKA